MELEKRKRGLGWKITVLCLLLAGIICASVCISGYHQYRASTFRTYNDFAYKLAATALAYVDGNRIAGYLEGGGTDAAYDEMDRQIYTLYKNTGLTSIYICVPDEAAMTVTTIYDVRVHDAQNPQAYALGVVDPIGSDDPQKVVDVYRTGKRPDDYFIRKNSFGYNTSAIVPVRNDAGEVTALLLADLPMPFILENLNAYLLSTVGITVVLVFLIIFGYLRFLQKRVVMPIQFLTKNAEAFAKCRTGFLDEMLNIHTGDEIETLAAALAKMEVDITKYINNLARVTADKERIATELAVATQIQTSMLPCIFPPYPDLKEFDIYALMQAAKEVGGDFYDFFLIDRTHLCVVIADVSGKGVPAALFMVIAKTLIKNHAQAGMSPKQVFEAVHDQLCENNEAGIFVTAFMGVLDVTDGSFTYVNAGHNPPLLSTGGAPYDWLKSKRGFVLAGMEHMKYSQQQITLFPGDSLLLYTDGVTEALNPREELYSEARLKAFVNSGRLDGCTLEKQLHLLRQELAVFADGAQQADDITMLILRLNEKGDQNG